MKKYYENLLTLLYEYAIINKHLAIIKNSIKIFKKNMKNLLTLFDKMCYYK